MDAHCFAKLSIDNFEKVKIAAIPKWSCGAAQEIAWKGAPILGSRYLYFGSTEENRMMVKNVAHQALIRGHTVRFTSAGAV